LEVGSDTKEYLLGIEIVEKCKGISSYEMAISAWDVLIDYERGSGPLYTQK